MVMLGKRIHKGDAMSATKSVTSLPIVLTRKRKKWRKRGSRKRARTTRKSIKVKLILVKSRTLVMKKTTKSVWQL